MSQINTVHKGDELEELVESLVKREISDGQFLSNSSLSSVYRQKAYYSRDREEYIKLDVTVEVRRPDANDYSVLYVFECKNYNSTVDISDLEEFENKLAQVACNKVKGIMVVSTKLSSTGLRFARNKNLCIARIVNNAFEYVVERTSNELRQLSVDEIFGKNEAPIPIGLYYDSKIFYSFKDYFKYCDVSVIETIKSDLNIPFIDNSLIKETVESAILRKFCPQVFSIAQATPLDDICDGLSKELSLDVINDVNLGNSNNKEVLGKIICSKNEIYISPKIKDDIHRYRFTLAHELGHLILHAAYLHEIIFDTRSNLNGDVSDKIKKRMEIQANTFAGYLLMPEHSVNVIALQEISILKLKPPLLLDDKMWNIDSCNKLIKVISKWYKVSQLAAKYRLFDLKLIENKSSMKRIGDLF